MDTLERLQMLLDERGWSLYQLAKKSGLSESTIANIYHRDTVPTIATLEIICKKGFGITMSQFFADGEMFDLDPQLREFVDCWVLLEPDQREAVLNLARSIVRK